MIQIGDIAVPLELLSSKPSCLGPGLGIPDAPCRSYYGSIQGQNTGTLEEMIQAQRCAEAASRLSAAGITTNQSLHHGMKSWH